MAKPKKREFVTLTIKAHPDSKERWARVAAFRGYSSSSLLDAYASGLDERITGYLREGRYQPHARAATEHELVLYVNNKLSWDDISDKPRPYLGLKRIKELRNEVDPEAIEQMSVRITKSAAQQFRRYLKFMNVGAGFNIDRIGRHLEKMTLDKLPEERHMEYFAGEMRRELRPDTIPDPIDEVLF